MIENKEVTFEIYSFQDIEKAVEITRREYRKTTAPIRYLLDGIVSLFIELLNLIGKVAKNTDEERYILEVLIVTFRRVIASIILLESGLPQEAHMVLRNALEWMLIAVDITYNKTSLEKWGKTGQDNDIDYNEWYFTPSRICKRINTDNEGNIYPKPDRSLALHIYKEWKNISNMSVHAHSHSQIKNLFSSTGTFQFLGRKAIDKYEIDFRTYQGIIFDIVSFLIGIPKYRELIGKTETLALQRDNFVRNYKKLKEELSITGRMMEENTMKVSLLDSQDKEIGVSSEIRTALDKLGAEAKAKVGTDLEQVTRKMLQLLEANGFEITKLKAVVTYTDTKSGNKIENITIYYLN